MMRIGLIADTHGLLRPQAIAALRGCDQIIHAGDIGRPELLEALAALAPLTVVRGNNDREAWATDLEERQWLRLGEHNIYVLHDLADLDIDPVAAGAQILVSGHSHKPLIREEKGVLYINPGSAGPRRFKLPVTVAELQLTGNARSARIVTLEI